MDLAGKCESRRVECNMGKCIGNNTAGCIAGSSKGTAQPSLKRNSSHNLAVIITLGIAVSQRSCLIEAVS